MGEMLDTTRDQMSGWRSDNPCAFGDQVDCSNPQTTSPGKVQCTGDHFSWYSRDHLKPTIEPPSGQWYKPGDFLAIRPLNWDDIIDEDDDDENWEDPGAPSGGRSRPVDGNDNDDGEGEEDPQGCDKGTGKRKGANGGNGKRKATVDGKGKRKATEEGNRNGNQNGNGNGKGKGRGIVKQTLGGGSLQSGGKATESKGNGKERAN